MRRALARFLFVTVLGALAMVLGIVTSMTLTPPGRDLLARTVSQALRRIVTGEVRIGAISGSFLYDLTLEDLVVRDTFGILLADIPRVRLSYRLPNFIRGDVVLNSLQLERPTIQVVKYRTGRMNYEDVLGLNRGPGGGRSPLIEFRDVRLRDGTLRIELPWNPGPSVGTSDARDSALAAERARPGRSIVETNQGLSRVIVFDDLTTVMPRLTISTPERTPLTIDLDSLATRVSDPAVTIRDVVGRLRVRGDSLMFSLARGALPNTRVSGGGAVTWPQDTVLFDFQLVAPQVDLHDLLWVSPDFPAMTGRGVLAAKSESGSLTAYTISDLHLRQGAQRIDGDMVTITDKRRGLGFRRLDVRLDRLDLDAARAYLDTLPFYGTLSGRVRGVGWIDSMRLNVDWDFADARVPGQPVTEIVADGVVLVRDPGGLAFRNVNLRRSNVDLRTARLLAPAVILDGRLAAAGTLDGPLENVTFEGVAEHRDGDRPVSIANGMVHLDTRRDTVAMNVDVVLDPLVFDGIRASFPTLATRGALRGRVRMDGTLDRMAVEVDVAGELGDVTARGLVTLLPPKWGAEELALDFRRLDLATLTGGSAPATVLNGEAVVTGVLDTLQAPEGGMHLVLADSRVREWTIDTLFTQVAVVDSVIRLDTLYAEWQGARVGGSGTLGWVRPETGRMQFHLAADSLVAFDSLALALTGARRDTSATLLPLNGAGQANLTLAGSLDSLLVGADFLAEGVVFQSYRLPEVAGSFTWIGGQDPQLRAAVSTDSMAIGTRALRNVAVDVQGAADSLGWSVGGNIGTQSRIDATGAYVTDSIRQVVTIDTLAATLASNRWRLTDSVTITLSDSAPALSPLELAAVDGSGAIRVEGRLPGSTPGALTVDAVGVDLQDVYGLAQLDTAEVGGRLGMNLQVGGTAADPTFRGTATVADARFGESRMPFVQGVVDYADRRLEANLLLWKTGEQILEVEARLPIDLAFRGVEQRQVEGPLLVRARGDSVDLAILEAVTPAVRNVTGTLGVDMQVEGTWREPRLAGQIEVNEGAMTVPALNVRFGTIDGRLAFSGDSVLFRDFYVTSGGGRLDVTGFIEFEALSRPVLALDLRANRFQAIDVPGFLSVMATGRVQLRGPLYQATLTGQATADRGVLHFADLINKNVIDLDDPTNADLVDTTVIRRRGLGAQFQNRFIDSLRIRGLELVVGEDFWLRSSEANIQLEGRVRVNKTADQYNIAGTFNALRGSYALKIGPVTRDFRVERGTVRYFGPATNAELDINARHVVNTADRGELPVVANITGTLLEPKLQLTSGTSAGAPLPEVDLVSYLILGVPSARAGAGELSAIQSVTSTITSAFSSEFERALISDLGLPVDLIEIRPAFSGTSAAQLVAGWQLGRKVFFAVNAGICTDDPTFEYKNLGAALELRFSREWRAQIQFEPTFQYCRTGAALSRTQLEIDYQAGIDLLWEREF